jgi:hypothetical protein
MPTVNTEKYHFDYIDTQYDVDCVSPALELCRWELFQTLIQRVNNAICKHGFVARNRNIISKAVTRMVFEGYSRCAPKVKDGLFNIIVPSISLMNDIRHSFTVAGHAPTAAQCAKVYNEIKLKAFVKKSLSTIKQCSKKTCAKATARIHLNKNVVVEGVPMVSVFVDRHPLTFSIPKETYERLKRRYTQYSKVHPLKFTSDDLIKCIMIRSANMDVGNQMGIPRDVKDQYAKCGIDFEGFASAINHHYTYYCSMFYDLEKYVGSVGNNMNITYKRGIYMHNPPYAKKLLYNIVKCMTKSMTKSNEDLCFVFGMPVWKEYIEFDLHKIIHSSKFYKGDTVLPAYKYKWYNFAQATYAKIPSSMRYTMANYTVDMKCLCKATSFWENY